MSEQAETTKKKGKYNWLIIGIVALLIGGGLGYVIGTNMSEADTKEKLEAEIASLEEDLENAQAGISSELEEGQEAVSEGQQTLEALQAENSSLKATIEQQNQKIADLEQQLEEANSTPPVSQ